jgi:hypothetical protein
MFGWIKLSAFLNFAALACHVPEEFDAYAYTKKCLLCFTHGETGVGGALAK